ncbi:MAG TPA: carbon-nitrogen hydrolase family protein [Pyrinomonadaceae bacterium]|jgi:predicted amidohydrolase|nr:carbon-nitrogen hydrolase family protein [Pyrinomonadaceae bacterium]
MRVAAIQLQPVIGDIDANLAACERLAERAAAEGAEWIVLPEFFTTGVGFFPELAHRSLPPDGIATKLLLSLARRHGAIVGGSFLCRDADGHVRNAFFLATPEGIAGRHDKDIPTMWENCFYVGGADDGLIEAGGLTAGVALCLEFNRTRTLKRLRGKADIVVGGSFKWGAPAWMPFRGHLQASIERYTDWAPRFARLVGCPVVEATHCGRIRCKTPMLPLAYETSLGGGASVCDAEGNVLARRDACEGAGVVVADVEAVRVEPDELMPQGFWIQELDPLSKAGWHVQARHGRRWYRRHVAPTAGRD